MQFDKRCYVQGDRNPQRAMRSDSYANRTAETKFIASTLTGHSTLRLEFHSTRLRSVCGNGTHLIQMSEEALLLHEACCFPVGCLRYLSLQSVEWQDERRTGKDLRDVIVARGTIPAVCPGGLRNTTKYCHDSRCRRRDSNLAST